MDEVAAGLTIDPDAMQANMDATEGAVLAERATFLLAEKMGKQKAGKLVEEALAKGGSFVEALGQLEKELSDETALLGYSPKFVDRLLAELRRKYQPQARRRLTFPASCRPCPTTCRD